MLSGEFIQLCCPSCSLVIFINTELLFKNKSSTLFKIYNLFNKKNMHQYLVNATIQIIPLAQDKHPYEWVDEAISAIQNSEIKYEVRPFSTELEGTYEQVMNVFENVNAHLLNAKCHEWITNLQIQIRSEGDMTAGEKTSKYQ